MNVKIGGGGGGAGFLEAKYGALPIGRPGQGLANSKMASYLDDTMFQNRIAAAEKLNVNFAAEYPQKQVRAYSDLYRDAIKLMKSEDLNAFALPGGKIFINAGAILDSRSEAELAGLLSHEIAHAALSHGFQLVTEGNLTANITSHIPLGRFAGSLITLNYSRNMERQADAFGTQVLAASPYAADGLYNLTVTLNEQVGDDGPPTWLSTHPGLEERVANIQAQIVSQNYDRYTFEGIDRHEEIQAIVRQLVAEEKRKEAAEEDQDNQDD